MILLLALLLNTVDVVIPVHKKDVENLSVTIHHVKRQVKDLGEVYVISKKPYTDKAIWISEEAFPFSIEDVGNELGRIGIGKHVRRGWYYQQLLKFYAHRVIDNLSENFLILDADTRTNHAIEFTFQGKPIMDFQWGGCWIKPYYDFMARMVPVLDDVDLDPNPVVHHAVFNQTMLESLFESVETAHQKPFWLAFCHSVLGAQDPDSRYFYAAASEYMLYYHYCLHFFPDQCVTRAVNLKSNSHSLKQSAPLSVDFVSFHQYDRTE